MAEIKLFDVLTARGHKQRWLLAQLQKRGHRFSEAYLSKVKSGAVSPSRRFIRAVSETLKMPEEELFATGSGSKPRRRTRKESISEAKNDGPINVAIIGVGNCAASLIQGVHDGCRRQFQYSNESQQGDQQIVQAAQHRNNVGYEVDGAY